jgi:hypothetical protein
MVLSNCAVVLTVSPYILVFELMDMNIYELIRNRKQYLKVDLVKVS